MAKGRIRKEVFSVVEMTDRMIVRERRFLCGRLRMVDRPLSLHAGGVYRADDKDKAKYDANRWDVARRARRLLGPKDRGKRKYDLRQDKTWSGSEEKRVVFSIVKADGRLVVREKRWSGGMLCDTERQLSLFDGIVWRPSPEDKRFNEARRRELVREGRGLLAPAEIKRIRKKLGVSQRRLSEILTGSASLLQRYEAGTAVPSVGTSQLLRLLDKYPELLAEL
jgi:DNA-binding transcriptional regulator YiaG